MQFYLRHELMLRCALLIHVRPVHCTSAKRSQRRPGMQRGMSLTFVLINHFLSTCFVSPSIIPARPSSLPTLSSTCMLLLHDVDQLQCALWLYSIQVSYDHAHAATTPAQQCTHCMLHSATGNHASLPLYNLRLFHKLTV